MKVTRFAIRDTYACPTLTIPGTCGSRISRLSQRAKLSPPFIVLFFATGWIYYRVASRLFGSPSTLIALFTLNTTPFFFASAGKLSRPRRFSAWRWLRWQRPACSFRSLLIRLWSNDFGSLPALPWV